MSTRRVADGRRPSIYDVAEAAGVSHQTVSRVVNGHPNIKESTRARVLRAIAEVRYTPNSIARALATSRTMQIGVLVDSSVEYGPNSTVRAIEAAARAVGYSVSAISIADEPHLGVASGLHHLVTQGVDALCMIAPRQSSIRAVRDLPVGLPTLVIKAEPDAHLLTAAVDQRAGAVAALEHLIRLGHREIVHVAGPADWLDARAREQAWRDCLEAAGLRVREPITGDWSADFGYQVGAHSAELDGATAVFAANDQLALGLLHGLRQRGVRVPEDVSVVGFDDLPDARHFWPPLTTVRQDFQALGRLILMSLLAKIEGNEPPEKLTIAPELVIRESTAAPALV